MKFFSKLKNLTNKLSLSFKRFPIALLFATVAVVVVIFMNHSDYGLREAYSKIAMTLALGIPLSLSVHVYFEGRSDVKRHFQIVTHAAVGVLLVLYYLSLVKDLDMVESTRYVAYTISFYLLFSFIPYLHRRENYELYVIKLFTRFIITYLYSMILYLGLAAILGTINLLFNANIPWEAFFDMGVIVAGIFAPAFFLSDVPKRDEEILVESYPKVLGVLLQFIVLPLLLVYTMILYAYFGKSIITMQLPQGVIGNLVLWYSIVSAIILFFIYPLRNANQWVKSFMMVFPKAIIPLLAMMFVAIGIRINTYGITESRYFVLVVGLWVSGVMVYYAIKKNISNMIITISLAIIGFLAVTGPWSAYSISQFSQNNRLEEILIRYDMIDQDAQIKKPEKEFVEADKIEASAIIMYFNRYHTIEDINYLPEDFNMSDMESLFGFALKDDGGGNYRDREYFSHYVDNRNILLDISDFHYFAEYVGYNSQSTQLIHDDYSIFYDKEQELVINHGEEIIYKKDLKEVAAEVHQKNQGQHNPPQANMTFTDENQAVKIHIAFRNINGFEGIASNEITVDGMEYYIFVKIK